jgi:hypothetical protein
MGINFYSTSPSPPSQQAGRLKPASHLLKVGIHSIVYAEDALSIIHRVPTTLFDQHLKYDMNFFSSSGMRLTPMIDCIWYLGFSSNLLSYVRRS